MSDDQSRFIRPKDLDNAQRTTWTAQLIWRLEAFAWDWLFWTPMSLMPVTWASNTIAAILKAANVIRTAHVLSPYWNDHAVTREPAQA